MTGKTIPFFNYPAIYREHEDEYARALTEACRRGAFIMQSDLFDFERALAEFAGVPHAIGVADGTMALLLSMLASPLEPGDEVLVPSHTFVASAAAIHHAGGVPVLVDCGRDHLIDPESVEASITSKTRAIMPVQLNGRAADMAAITDIAERHGLFIVEDACQALGAEFRGRQAGTFGLTGAISFYPSKTLGCFGDGGAVLTSDDEVAAKLRVLRDHGREENGNVTVWGFNSRLDNLQAAVLNLKLSRYAESIARRREIARLYQARLEHIDELLLPPGPEDDADRFDIYQNYEIEAENRDELRSFLAQRGIGTILQWGGKGIHEFTDLGFTTVPPYTERVLKRFMLLPMHTALTDEEVSYVCDGIEEFYSGTAVRLMGSSG